MKNKYTILAPYYDDKCIPLLTKELGEIINEETIIVCIGSDKSIGDAFGPLVGSYLVENGINNVYGTLADPIHALNIYSKIGEIYKKHGDENILAIDASLGDKNQIGYIKIDNGSLSPGKGVGKNLPSIGTISLKFIVSEMDEIFKFNNVSLSFVMQGAKVVSAVLSEILKK